jgi:hypothetical protein
MIHTYSNLLIHTLFSTKKRTPLLVRGVSNEACASYPV